MHEHGQRIGKSLDRLSQKALISDQILKTHIPLFQEKAQIFVRLLNLLLSLSFIQDRNATSVTDGLEFSQDIVVISFLCGEVVQESST